MELEIDHIKPVFVWFWDADCEYCPICRAMMTEECVNCQTDEIDQNATKLEKSCSLVWGGCNHAFHNCCMEKWLERSQRCPLCQQDWKQSKSNKI